MHRFSWKWTVVGTLCAVLLLVAGCGDDEPEAALECGDNTEVRDGECVVSEHDCENGEVVAPSGECVDPAEFCDDDTAVYDTGTGECLEDYELVCGEGTVEVDGLCVVDVPGSCGAGTVLVDGVCELADDVCGEGTRFSDDQCEATADACDGEAQFDLEAEECVFVEDLSCGDSTVERDGECRPYHTVAEELADDADINYADGAPIVTDPDDPFVFTGTMDDSVSHTFDLEGQEGQWIDITIMSLGLPSPGFDLDGPASFQRVVSPAMQSAPSRTVLMPEDETYSLTITTSVSDDELADDAWGYVGVVEVLDAPEADHWDYGAENIDGDLSEPKNNFVQINTSDADDLFLSIESLGEDVEDVQVSQWSSEDSFTENHDMDVSGRIELNVSGQNEVFLQFDAVELTGSRTDFEISGTGSETIPQGGFDFHELSAEAGDTLVIRHESDQAGPVNVRVFRDGDEFVAQQEDVLAYNSTSFLTGESDSMYVPATQDGDYLIEFQNVEEDDLTGFISTSTVTDDIPFFGLEQNETKHIQAELGGDNLEQGQWKVMFVEFPSPGLLEGIGFHDGTTFSADMAVFDMHGNKVDEEGGLGQTGGETHFEFTTTDPGIHMVAMKPRSSFTTISNLEVDFTAQAVEAIEPNEKLEYTFDAEGFDILSGHISNNEGPAPDVRLYNPDGVLILDKSDVDDLNLVEVLPGPGEYTLEVENTGNDAVVGLAVNLEVNTPFDVVETSSGFNNTYNNDALEEGEKDVLLFNALSDFRINFSALFDEEEDGVVRIWDANAREVVTEISDEEQIELEGQSLEMGTYVIEFEAETDVDDYVATFSGNSVNLVEVTREHDPDLVISPGGSLESTALGVTDCPEIIDISLTMDFTDTPLASNLAIWLYAPELDVPIAVRDQTTGNHNTTYPDETEPDESFDSLLGTMGTGVWCLDIENFHNSNSAELNSWTLELTCILD